MLTLERAFVYTEHMLNETLLAALQHSSAMPPGLRVAYQRLAVSPRACLLCSVQPIACDDCADHDRADREEHADDDADIDFARRLAAGWAERGGVE